MNLSRLTRGLCFGLVALAPLAFLSVGPAIFIYNLDPPAALRPPIEAMTQTCYSLVKGGPLEGPYLAHGSWWLRRAWQIQPPPETDYPMIPSGGP